MVQTLKHWFKQDTVLCIAWLLALGTMFLVPPDTAYIGYIDFHTLGLLFALMAVMAGLQSLGLFRRVGEWMLSKTRTTRQLEAVLLFLPFFSSMLVTNDVALITFVPFALEVLRMAQQEHRTIPVVAMQTVAANLGSMTTPIGNPQNLYLYSHFELSMGDFFRTMLPLTIGAAVLLIAFLFCTKSAPLYLANVSSSESFADSKKSRLLLYGLLFLVCLCAVAKFLPVSAAVLLVLLGVFWADRLVLKQVDYALLFTFLGFFIFVGNLGRVDAFRELLQTLLTGREVLFSILASQVISNVPAALLLSGFTDEAHALLVGTNLGGLGTLIASMASLISYKYISRFCPKETGRYLLWFTAANLLFLVLLYALYCVL